MTEAGSIRTVDTSPARTIPAFYRLLLRGQLTRGRIAGLVALAAIAVLFAGLSRVSDDPVDAALFTVADYAVSLLVPLAAVMIASPMFGNLVEDRLLVYLWLKPPPRWHIAVAALSAVTSALLPVTLLPVLASVLITGELGLLWPAALATVLGVLAYSGLYLWLGLRFNWGLWLGLLYLALWENTIARFGDGPARFSLRSYLVTIVEWGTDREIGLADRASWAAVCVPLAVAVASVVLVAWTLRSRDVD